MFPRLRLDWRFVKRFYRIVRVLFPKWCSQNVVMYGTLFGVTLLGKKTPIYISM